jgi:hypothetical protein
MSHWLSFITSRIVYHTVGCHSYFARVEINVTGSRVPGPCSGLRYFGRRMFGILFGPGGINFMAMQAHLAAHGENIRMTHGHGGYHILNFPV